MPYNVTQIGLIFRRVEKIKLENMDIKDSIRDEIQYCEKKAIEYKNDAKNKIGGKIDLWRGKSEVHEYMAVRLKRVLAWHESKPEN